MRSIIFRGVDFSEFSSAEVVEKVALPVDVATMAVPGEHRYTRRLWGRAVHHHLKEGDIP